MKTKGISLLLTFFGFGLLITGVRAQNPISSIDLLINLPSTPVAASLGSYGIESEKTHPSITQANFFNNFSKLSQSDQHKQIMMEVDQYVAGQSSHQQRVNNLIENAVNAYPSISYSMPRSPKEGKELFYDALNELASMLTSNESIDLMKAVYLVEHAYDPTIAFEYFDTNIKQAASHILMKLDQEGYDRSDNLAKNMMLFRYMADTLEVDYPGIEEPIVSYPKTYDFHDFWGNIDYTKMFVSKLIREGTGQCRSLPLLYLLIAEQIEAKASLAFAPNHSYIKFQDGHGTWQSLELTVGAVSSENFIIEGGFVKSEAIKSRIYLEPITDKQLVAQIINDLVMAYTKKYGHDDDRFIQDAIGLVYREYPNSITVHQIMANYYQHRLNYVIRQYNKLGLTKEEFAKDPKAQSLVKSMIGANKHIDKLGYAPMPEKAYEDWLQDVREQAAGQYSQVKMQQFNNLIKD